MTAAGAAPCATIRDVEISTLSPRAELLTVLRVGVAIACGLWLYLANQSLTEGTPADGALPTKNLLPFQTLAQNQNAGDQRTFRALQVALIEAQNLRSSTGAWPDVASMSEQGIEPFAVDPTNKYARHTWRLLKTGFYVNYLGIPDRPEAPAWLMVVVEPDPSLPAEPYQNDEEHARLADGTLLHVSIWQHANGTGVAAKTFPVPQAAGWMQVFAVGPAATR